MREAGEKEQKNSYVYPLSICKNVCIIIVLYRTFGNELIAEQEVRCET